jgi:hypothetical protein
VTNPPVTPPVTNPTTPPVTDPTTPPDTDLSQRHHRMMMTLRLHWQPTTP